MEKVGLQIKEGENFTSLQNEFPANKTTPCSLSRKKKETLARQRRKGSENRKKPVREWARTETPKQHWLVTKRFAYHINLIKYAYIAHTTRAMCGFSQSPSVCVFLRMYQPNPFFLHSSPTQPSPPSTLPTPFHNNNKHPPLPNSKSPTTKIPNKRKPTDGFPSQKTKVTIFFGGVFFGSRLLYAHL